MSEPEYGDAVARIDETVAASYVVELPDPNTIAGLSARIDRLTGAVNSFGESLQFIVNQVSNVGKAVASGGIGGLMSQIMGGKK